MWVQSKPCLGDDSILAFIAGTADARAAAALRQHVDDCEPCRQLVAEAGRAVYEDNNEATTVRGPGLSPRAVVPHGSRIGRYVLGDQLGEGGMGTVYAAHDPQLKRKVAVKILRADVHDLHGEARLLREAQAMAQLSHPNVVHVYDAGVQGHQVFIAMEHVDGATMSRWLRTARRGWREILDAFVAAGRGLAAAHQVGIVHRDFKPGNVLLSVDRRVLVTDFGLARAEGHGTWDLAPVAGPVSQPSIARGVLETLTQTGGLVGTPAYMAPEHFLGAPPDTRADQYAFSVALLEALWGAHPYARALERGDRDRIGVIDSMPARSEVPPSVMQLVMRGMARDPRARFASMDVLLGALESAAVAASAPARRRGRLLAVTAAAAALAIAAVGAWAIAGRTPDGDRGAAHAAVPAVTTVDPAPTPAPSQPVVEPPAPAAPHDAPIAAARETSRKAARKPEARTRSHRPPKAARATTSEDPDGLIRDLWKK